MHTTAPPTIPVGPWHHPWVASSLHLLGTADQGNVLFPVLISFCVLYFWEAFYHKHSTCLDAGLQPLLSHFLLKRGQICYKVFGGTNKGFGNMVTPPNFEQRGSVPPYFLENDGVEVERTSSFLPQGGMMAWSLQPLVQMNVFPIVLGSLPWPGRLSNVVAQASAPWEGRMDMAAVCIRGGQRFLSYFLQVLISGDGPNRPLVV